MHKLIYALLISTGALFSGCAIHTPPTQAVIDAADHGIEPSEDEVKKLVNVYLEATLKDFESARIKNIKKEKGYRMLSSIANGSAHEFGWFVTFEVNAKNSYGGYVGYKPYSIVIRNGKIITSY